MTIDYEDFCNNAAVPACDIATIVIIISINYVENLKLLLIFSFLLTFVYIIIH